MMGRSVLYLSIDTATSRSSVALGEPGTRVPDAVIASRNDLSRLLGNVVRDLTRDRGIRVRDIGGIILADGPGSFTGLRIGAAFAKGLHDAAGMPLFTAPSLMGAASMTQGSVVVAEYDALRGDVYRAIYAFRQPAAGSRQPAVETIMSPELVPAEAPPPVHDYVRADERNASAAALLLLMGMAGGPARIEDPSRWQPDYGRPAEAEARRLARDAAPRG